MSFLKSSVVNTKKFNNKILLNTIFYPKIDRHESDIYIISKIYDRFDSLADKYYKDVDLWWIIAKASNIHNGSMFIEPGIQIRIPSQVDTIIQNFINLNG